VRRKQEVAGTEIKRGTTPCLTVRLKGLEADAAVESVEFVFKQECAESAPELVRKSWPKQVERTAEGLYRVPFSEEETRLFKPGRYMYMDARVRFAGGGLAAPPMAALMVRPTLFTEEAGA